MPGRSRCRSSPAGPVDTIPIVVQNLAIHEAAVDTGGDVVFKVTVTLRRGIVKLSRGRTIVDQTLTTGIEEITAGRAYRVRRPSGDPDWIVERTGGCTSCGYSTDPPDVIARLNGYRG